MLARLDEATRPQDLNLPGYRLHPLKGDLAGYWSITVSGNGRIIVDLLNFRTITSQNMPRYQMLRASRIMGIIWFDYSFRFEGGNAIDVGLVDYH